MKNLVGIIGGAGAEGSHFAEILSNFDLEIVLSDINTEKALNICEERGYRLMSSEELASKSNLVFFSLPIEITEYEVKRLAPLAKEAIADFTSVKTKAVNAMLEYSKPGVEVFSIHAMYRPTVSPWGQNVLMIAGKPEKGGDWFNTIKGIMEKKKANVSVLKSAKQHDELSMVLQVLPHTLAYAHLKFLERYIGLGDVRLEHLQRYSTLFSRLMMETTGRVVSNPKSGSMYGLIQSENPNTEFVYDGLAVILNEMKNLVTGKPLNKDWGNVTGHSIDSFSEDHRKLNTFLGRYAEAAAEATDKRMGKPLGLQIVYEEELHDLVEKILGGFKKAPEKYKEQLETARIPNGELTKLNLSEEIILAKQTFYRAKESESEGNYGFHLKNKTDNNGRIIRFSPIIPEDITKSSSDIVIIQMYNIFYDHFLNLFNTWERTQELHSLGSLVAYKSD